MIERFENVDLMPTEIKFQGHEHSAMISMLFDMNTHFGSRVIRNTCHQYGQAWYWRATRAEIHQVGAYPQFLINLMR